MNKVNRTQILREYHDYSDGDSIGPKLIVRLYLNHGGRANSSIRSLAMKALNQKRRKTTLGAGLFTVEVVEVTNEPPPPLFPEDPS